MASVAAGVLVSAIAAGVALSGYAMTSRASNDDLRDDLAARYAQLSEEDPSACVGCVYEAIDRTNAFRVDMASPDALRASMIADAMASLDERRRGTAAFLAAKDDCRLRACLADALTGVTVGEAEAAMSALDHLLEADDSLRDVHVDFAGPPLTVAQLAAAVEYARA
jgi:hypothetical protein